MAAETESWEERMDREFREAPTREAKLAVLKQYMGDRDAEEFLPVALGERSSDVRDLDGAAR
jgi:hypothetical protein